MWSDPLPKKVILDTDLSNLYGVSTKQLNQQVKRNKDRFPEDFIFQLTDDEKTKVVTNCDHLGKLKYSPTLPYAFTEHGAVMAANIIKSSCAVQMSVFIVRAFVKMREQLLATATLAKRLAEVEKLLLVHDSALRDLYQEIQHFILPPRNQIGRAHV